MHIFITVLIALTAQGRSQMPSDPRSLEVLKILRQSCPAAEEITETYTGYDSKAVYARILQQVREVSHCLGRTSNTALLQAAKYSKALHEYTDSRAKECPSWLVEWLLGRVYNKQPSVELSVYEQGKLASCIEDLQHRFAIIARTMYNAPARFTGEEAMGHASIMGSVSDDGVWNPSYPFDISQRGDVTLVGTLGFGNSTPFDPEREITFYSTHFKRRPW